MFGLEKEEQQKSSEQKIAELEITIKAMEKERQAHLKEVGLTQEEVKDFLNNPDNFSPELWELVQYNLKKMDDKLERDLENIRNPEHSGEKLRKSVAPVHWIPVR